ncbi:uncharacterized protein LOC111702367 [Eurytemora carolleeae]|uniref:uncharacterized protein LOC111702367 n=1 Tax=Eurytemora carolleeae TaxID=1294199 RepID=UPI000C78D3F5|nr:uncharacterized protein LOC111702367 [Eurytemora carolleeae]|eukprot:XP_023329797.1 uncharacterized protein LOC111702367 [Eurytemora affinis]
MPNPAARRGSMANFAFPELHSKAKLKNEPENLLVLTTTRIFDQALSYIFIQRTDTRGRRHSVAVPLIPPPDGEKFEGGYHIERNPITGGARLVPPPPELKDIKRRLRREPVRSLSQEPDLSTISEYQGTPVALSSRLKTSSSSSRSSLSSHGSNPVPSSSRSGRRHSIQVTPLTKELEKLKLADKASNGTKPGKKVERRASSRRRSSRQGFLHFLDLAIAN